MNKTDMKRLDGILHGLTKLQEQLSDYREKLEEIVSSEEEKYDNLSESQQEAEKGEQIQEGIGTLESICEYITDAESYLSNALDDLGEFA